MSRRREGGRRWSWALALGLAAGLSGGAAGLATWLLVHARPGWTNGDALGAAGLAAGLVSALIAPFGQGQVDRWFAERRQAGAPAEREGDDALDRWLASLRRGVSNRRTHGPRSQLEQTLRAGVLLDPDVVGEVGVGFDGAGEPRLRVRGRVGALRGIVDKWDA